MLPLPLHKDLNVGDMRPCPDGGLGMICSFSLPIITICALILLMIIVKLLDIVFRWMPFFQICLPVPKFDAKGNEHDGRRTHLRTRHRVSAARRR